MTDDRSNNHSNGRVHNCCAGISRSSLRRQSARRRHRHRRSELEQNAAARTYNGNGMSVGNLPPLPTTDDGYTNDDDHDKEKDDSNLRDETTNGGGGGCLSTLFGHPYGALPYGNIHLATLNDHHPYCHPDIVRHSGLGPFFRILNDDQLLSILSYIDGTTLARGIIQTSRFMYVAGHHEELWRDLVLRESWGEEGFVVPPPSIAAAEASTNTDPNGATSRTPNTRKKRSKVGCWKDIYAYNYYHHHHHHRHHHNDYKDNNPRVLLQHNPIHIAGIYSDTFFRSWLCRSFALLPSWLSTHTVPMLQHDNVTTETFLEYEERNVPLLIRGASTTWGALRKWKQPDYLVDVCRNTKFRATSGAAPLPTSFTMRNYFNYCASSTEESPLYLFDRSFGSKVPQLLRDFEHDLKESCPWWDADSDHGHDLFRVLGEERRPDHQWLIVGPKRSGSCFHIDPNCTHAWNAPILGRKRWIFYPPGVTPPGIHPSPDGDDVCMPISIGEWFLTYWNEHVERRMDSDVSKRPLECTARPGDVLFVPHGWWHMVLNIGSDDDDADNDDDDDNHDNENASETLNNPLRGVSMALTRNYVSASNLPDVLRFLDTRVGQISGCRDRKEAVQPEELGREFRSALMAVNGGDRVDNGKDDTKGRVGFEEKKLCDDVGYPEKIFSDGGRWANLLRRSELRAKDGWSCNAWSDINQSFDSTMTKKRRVGSSILTQAKQTSINATRDVAADANGFSFSFFS